MNIKRILPMEINFRIKNLKDFIFQKNYQIGRKQNEPLYFYLDAATYNNLGDQAISLAIIWFLWEAVGREHVRVVNETDVVRVIASLKRQLMPEDVIVLSGGGNMGDMYPRYESLRRLIIQEFPRNNIIIFPQTIDYTKDSYGRKEMDNMISAYQAHKKLMLCARETITFETMKSFHADVDLVPDIVLSMYGRFASKGEKTHAIGFCVRDDKESCLSKQDLEYMISDAKSQGFVVDMLSTMSDELSFRTVEQREKAIADKLLEFSEYEYIVTDRLHGMIFSILANTPCMIIDNSNHKVFGVYETICKYVTGVIKVVDRNVFHNRIRNNKQEEVRLDLPFNTYAEIKRRLKRKY